MDSTHFKRIVQYVMRRMVAVVVFESIPVHTTTTRATRKQEDKQHLARKLKDDDGGDDGGGDHQMMRKKKKKGILLLLRCPAFCFVFVLYEKGEEGEEQLGGSFYKMPSFLLLLFLLLFLYSLSPPLSLSVLRYLLGDFYIEQQQRRSYQCAVCWGLEEGRHRVICIVCSFLYIRRRRLENCIRYFAQSAVDIIDHVDAHPAVVFVVVLSL